MRHVPGIAVVSLGVLTALACSSTTAPSSSLVGSWELIGYSDGTVAESTTGTAVFRPDGSFTITGSITYPGEPTEPIDVAGTYSQQGSVVRLTTGAGDGMWQVAFAGADVTLTLQGQSPATFIRLRRS
jgi:hypothetical protein